MGPKITILTDHKNLEYWKTKKDHNLRQARWGERFANNDFAIKYRPGKLAGTPDILSRQSGDAPWEGNMKHRQNHSRILLPEEAFEALQANTTETINLEIDKELLNEIRTLSAADKEFKEIRRKKASGTTHDGKIALGICQENSGLLMYDGLIWVLNNDTLRLCILRDHHDTQAAGHPGRARTLELVSRNFYWPGQRKYIHRSVDHCVLHPKYYRVGIRIRTRQEGIRNLSHGLRTASRDRATNTVGARLGSTDSAAPGGPWAKYRRRPGKRKRCHGGRKPWWSS